MRRFLLAGLVFVCTLPAQPKPGGGSIEGHVLNAVTSAPIRKATVTLRSPQVSLVASTNAEGAFQFTALPAGVYRLSASRNGFLDGRVRRPVTLGANDRATDAEIRLAPQSVITGHILDEDGDPVDRARVRMFKQVYRDGRKSWDSLNSAPETNDSGEYRFPNLTPGRYLVQAYNGRPEVANQYGSPPKAFYIPTYYPSAAGEQEAQPVEIGVGASVDGIDVHLLKLAKPPLVHVRGKVTGLPPGSQEVISIVLRAADGGSFGQGTALAEPPDYNFDLSVPPGEYAIFGGVYSGGPEAYGTGSLTVTGDVAGVVLAMSPAAEITGRLRLAEEGPRVSLESVRLLLTQLSNPLSQTFELRPEATGKFAASRPFSPGHYALKVRSVPDGCFVQGVKLDGQEISPDDFGISSSGHLEVVLSRMAGRISGSVEDADGKPFPDSTVTLVPTEGKSWPAKQAADDAGKFHFGNLRPGKYKLFAWEEVDNDLWQDPEFQTKYEGRATAISVGPSETQNVQLRAITQEEMK